MATTKTIKKILKFLEDNPHKDLTLHFISSETKIHHYPTKEVIELLTELNVVGSEKYKNSQRYFLKGGNSG